jgi:peptide chain release factor 1
MKCESGVHKVIRVPETEARGRLHSSTMSVVVMPTVPFDYVVNEKDIRYDYMRAQGAGGQHVNKTESACRAVHIPSNLSVFIQEFRVQEQNRRRAVEILKQRVFEQ